MGVSIRTLQDENLIGNHLFPCGLFGLFLPIWPWLKRPKVRARPRVGPPKCGPPPDVGLFDLIGENSLLELHSFDVIILCMQHPRKNKNPKFTVKKKKKKKKK